MAQYIADFFRLSLVWKIIVAGIFPGILGLAVSTLLEIRLSGQTVVRSLEGLGLGRPAISQMLIASLAAVPILIGFLLLFFAFDAPMGLASYPGLRFAKFVVAQGLAEEVIFRGFLYRRLRPGRSYLRATILSALLFSFCHIGILGYGFSPHHLYRLSISLVFGFVLSFPATYLFELGRKTIWGFGMLHVLIDLIDLFPQAARQTQNMYFFLCFVLISAVSVFLIAKAIGARLPEEVSGDATK